MEWQPIETAPKDGTPILLFDPTMSGDYVHFVTRWTGAPDTGWWDDPDYVLCKPTHWARLTPPPEFPR